MKLDRVVTGCGLMVAAVFAASLSVASGVRAVSTEEIQRLLKEEPKQVYLLDVRTPAEWASGRIAGAVHIPMDQVPSKLSSIPKNKKIVAVCASGARSGAVARYLVQNGYPWVGNYEAGMAEWTRRGLPVER